MSIEKKIGLTVLFVVLGLGVGFFLMQNRSENTLPESAQEQLSEEAAADVATAVSSDTTAAIDADLQEVTFEGVDDMFVSIDNDLESL